MSSSGISFYREVLRSVRRLPRESHSYYRVVAREKFVAHRGEDDEDRISKIIGRSKEDVAWIIRKYCHTPDSDNGTAINEDGVGK